jgi:hypothetical protein
MASSRLICRPDLGSKIPHWPARISASLGSMSFRLAASLRLILAPSASRKSPVAVSKKPRLMAASSDRGWPEPGSVRPRKPRVISGGESSSRFSLRISSKLSSRIESVVSLPLTDFQAPPLLGLQKER